MPTEMTDVHQLSLPIPRDARRLAREPAAARTLVVHDPRGDGFRGLDAALTECQLTARWIPDVAAIAELRPAEDCGVALVAIRNERDTEAPIADAITALKHKGYTVLCYWDSAAALALGTQCRLLLAGASHLLDANSPTFGSELCEWLTHLIEAERERRREERAIAEQLRGLGMVGTSPSITAVFRMITRVSVLSDLPVLISGETGSGKELVARSIHRLDPRRREAPFVAVNCGAISAGLAESELFGHRRGAFTGADHDRKGLIRAARGGVLFLDEIGDLEPALQGKLLRVLQEGRVLALGEDHEVPVNVRIIAATNRNLDEMVRRQAFRADLFHRLDVLSIRLPALRERPEDIDALVQHFIAQSADSASSETVTASDDFLHALRKVDLPGNVRQLENVVRRALVTRKRGQPLRLNDLPPELLLQIADVARPPGGADAAAPTGSSATTIDALAILTASSWKLGGALDLCEQKMLSAALRMSSGNRSRAARLLGISARSIFNKMRKHRLTA